jgi:hypothetical protein
MSDNMSYTLHFGADSQAAITLDDDATITMDLKDGSQRSIIAIPARLAAPYAEHFAHRPDQSPVQLPGGAGNGPGGSAGIRPEKGPGGGWGMTHCTMKTVAPELSRFTECQYEPSA